MKRAIVLSGGGSRGAYEQGAWRALRELGIEYQMITGTSIGSINAALMAQGDFDLAEHLWDTITLDQVMADGINLYPDIEKYFNKGPRVRSFLKSYAHHKGADISPLVELIKRTIDEEKVRASDIDMGLVTVKFPSFTPVERMLDEIPHGQLHDHLLASAAVFPAFPIHQIDDEGYIDGGYYDAMPINLALRNGAEEIVAIDLYEKMPHKAMMGRPWLRRIGPSHSLGSILLFERPMLNRNRRLGYLDTMKSYRKMLGTRYAFDRASVEKHTARAREFALMVARAEAEQSYKNSFAQTIVRSPMFEALKRLLPDERIATEYDDMLIGAEVLADHIDLDPTRCYDLDEFNELVFDQLPVEDVKKNFDAMSENEVGMLVNALLIADKKEVPLLMMYLYRAGMLRGTLLRALSIKAEDLLGAFYLHMFLPE